MQETLNAPRQVRMTSSRESRADIGAAPLPELPTAGASAVAGGDISGVADAARTALPWEALAPVDVARTTLPVVPGRAPQAGAGAPTELRPPTVPVPQISAARATAAAAPLPAVVPFCEAGRLALLGQKSLTPWYCLRLASFTPRAVAGPFGRAGVARP